MILDVYILDYIFMIYDVYRLYRTGIIVHLYIFTHLKHVCRVLRARNFFQLEGCGSIWCLLHLRQNLLVSGSDDATVRLWDIEARPSFLHLFCLGSRRISSRLLLGFHSISVEFPSIFSGISWIFAFFFHVFPCFSFHFEHLF